MRASIDFSFSLERNSSITLHPALNMDSDAIVENVIANISAVILDNILYFTMLFIQESKAQKEAVLGMYIPSSI